VAGEPDRVTRVVRQVMCGGRVAQASCENEAEAEDCSSNDGHYVCVCACDCDRFSHSSSPIPSHPTDGFQLCSVGLLARGSLRFPCLPSFPVAIRGTLAAYSRGGGCGIGPPDGIRPYRIPGYPLTLCVLGEAPNAPLCDFDSTFVKADSRHIRWAKRRKSKGNLRGKIRYFVDNLPKSAICGVVSLTLGHKGRHTTGQSESYEFTA
jgi:hypothetical protein